MITQAFIRAVETALGEPIESLRSKPIDQRRVDLEFSSGRSLRFASRFPDIGRGNILRDCVVSHERAEAAFKEAIADE